MSIANLTTAIKEQGDSLGGFILESDTYNMGIEMAYVDESKGGATSINFMFKDNNGKSLRQVIYVTSGRAKGQKHTYTDKKGAEQYLPGFSQVNSICLLSVGKELAAIATEKKMVNVYDADLKKEVPKERDVMMGLLGAEITLGVIRQIVDKNAAGNDGVYRPTGETREENEIDKSFRTKDGLTAAEIRGEATEAVFKGQWEEKNRGVTRNKAKGLAAGQGAPASLRSCFKIKS